MSAMKNQAAQIALPERGKDEPGIGRRSIHLAADALRSLADSLDGDAFEQAVTLCADLGEGRRVVTCGVGKAGYIAMKVSATLASTGSSSFFLHGTEAAHGDLGRISAGDVLVAFSYSGETKEMIELLPRARHLGAHCIGVTGDAASRVAQSCQIHLNLGRIPEACPLGLAPTTSTVAMLAVGDALALAIMERRGFTPEDYALRHPDGSLGRSLLRVSGVMRTGSEHCTVLDTLPCIEVVQQMGRTAGKPGAVSVIDDSGRLVGIFTDGDLRRHLAGGTEFLSRPIAESMGKNPKVVLDTDLAKTALEVLSHFQVDQLPVVDEARRPVGMVEIQDLVRLGFRLHRSAGERKAH